MQYVVRLLLKHILFLKHFPCLYLVIIKHLIQYKFGQDLGSISLVFRGRFQCRGLIPMDPLRSHHLLLNLLHETVQSTLLLIFFLFLLSKIFS